MKLDVIYNEDCLKGMKKLPNKSVDLILTDPPYNLQKDFENDNLSEDDFISINNLFALSSLILPTNMSTSSQKP